jgi:hypothetical protein
MRFRDAHPARAVSQDQVEQVRAPVLRITFSSSIGPQWGKTTNYKGKVVWVRLYGGPTVTEVFRSGVSRWASDDGIDESQRSPLRGKTCATRYSVRSSAAPWAFAGSAGRPTIVTLDGVAGVVPGMSPAQVSPVWVIPVSPGPAVASPACQEAVIRDGAVHGYALFEQGHLGAAWFDRGVRTPSGITVGSTVTQLVRAYSDRMRAEPHAYEPGGQYFFLTRQQSPHWKIWIDTNAAAASPRSGSGTARSATSKAAPERIADGSRPDTGSRGQRGASRRCCR